MKGFFDIHNLKGKKLEEVFVPTNRDSKRGGEMAKNKQGEHKEITREDESEFKSAPIIKKGDSSIITMKNGKPVKLYFTEGKQVGEEDV